MGDCGICEIKYIREKFKGQIKSMRVKFYSFRNVEGKKKWSFFIENIVNSVVIERVVRNWELRK